MSPGRAKFLLPDLGPLRAALGAGAGGPFMLLDAQGDVPSGFLAVGAQRSLTLNAGREGGFEGLEAFISASTTRTFGWISYDPREMLGCDWDVGLPPPPIEFPAIHWFEPAVLLKFEGVGMTARIENWAGRDHPWADLAERAIREPFAPGARPEDQPLPPTQAHLNPTQYARAFEGVQGNIQRGDVYELNLCNTLVGRTPVNERAVFSRLMEATRPPHAAWIGFNEKAVLSASPERFLKREGDRLVSQPIKGTAPRLPDPALDLAAAERLKADPKERAENVMITDLVRNDLSRVAQKSTVEVTELCGVHSFKNVHQMISTVVCTVRNGVGMAEILRATFPMGSMTGAPKQRAMELISTYEPAQRGLYSGALGWAEPGGDFDLSVVIRTALIDHRTHAFVVQTGGAITCAAAQQAEWDETLLKARTLLEALAP
jgi:para-aminobenzoate synthetase component 1